MHKSIVSLIVMLMMLAFTTYRVIIFVTKSDPNVSKQSYMRDLEFEDPLVPNDYGFELAFGIGKEIDPTYGYIIANKVKNYADSSSGLVKRIKEKSVIEVEDCGVNHFQAFNQSLIGKLGINKLKCFQSQDFELEGQFYNDVYQYLELRLYRCKNDTVNQRCKSDQAINEYFRGQKLQVVLVNSYFDFNEFEHLQLDRSDKQQGENNEGFIKQYIDDRFFFELEGNRAKKGNVFLQKSQAQLQDDYMQLGQEFYMEFIEVSNFFIYDAAYDEADNFLVSVYVRYDQQYNIQIYAQAEKNLKFGPQ